MINVSEVFNEVIRGNNLQSEWSGTITLTDETEHTFTNANIDQGSGDIVLSCCPASEIGIGYAYLGEFTVRLLDLDVDRYQLKDAVINLMAAIKSVGRIRTWEDASAYTWTDLSTHAWGEAAHGIDVDFTFHMGMYRVEEAMRSNDAIKITAYDFMRDFDKKLPNIDSTARLPYDWFVMACTTCGIQLSTPMTEIRSMPNGNRLMKFSNASDNMETWRDFIAELAATLGANCFMDRTGKLMVRRYSRIIADAVCDDFRYSSKFSDYQSYYTGIYLTFKEGGIQEYQRNAATAEADTGLSYDLGSNSFLQITDQGARQRAIKQIIDAHKDLVFAPFQVTMPFNPVFELMDTLQFAGNQAQIDDIAPITSIHFRIGGKMDISCGGENPALQESRSKDTKAIDSVSSGNNGADFWMVMDNAPAETSITIQKNTPTEVGEALFYASKDLSMLAIAYTASFELSETVLAKAYVYVDETLVYTMAKNLLPNENSLTVTTGCEVSDKGSHAVSVKLEIRDTTLTISGGTLSLS